MNGEWRPIGEAPTEGPARYVAVLVEDDVMLAFAPFFRHHGERAAYSVETSNIRKLGNATHFLPLPSSPEDATHD